MQILSSPQPFFFFFFYEMRAGSDNLARCGALESLVNNTADDTWDNKAVNRISAIHFLDDDEDDDDEKVRLASWSSKVQTDLSIRIEAVCWHLALTSASGTAEKCSGRPGTIAAPFLDSREPSHKRVGSFCTCSVRLSRWRH